MIEATKTLAKPQQSWDDYADERRAAQSDGRTCGDCRWWDPMWANGQDTVNTGYCHRYAPSMESAPPDRDPDDGCVRFPKTDSDDWCGEFAVSSLPMSARTER